MAHSLVESYRDIQVLLPPSARVYLCHLAYPSLRRCMHPPPTGLPCHLTGMHVRACVRVCICACVRVRVRVRARVHACMCVRARAQSKQAERATTAMSLILGLFSPLGYITGIYGGARYSTYYIYII